jgi:hypothetical protein
VQNLKGSEETPEDAIKETNQVNDMNLGVSTEDVCLAAFATTEFNKIFSSRQPLRCESSLMFQELTQSLSSGCY